MLRRHLRDSRIVKSLCKLFEEARSIEPMDCFIYNKLRRLGMLIHRDVNCRSELKKFTFV
jgi:hypothetical protein